MHADGQRDDSKAWRKQLHEVVALNLRCVDCNTPIDKATAWASINLGVFICIDVSSPMVILHVVF
jgi:hypothetical protein